MRAQKETIVKNQGTIVGKLRLSTPSALPRPMSATRVAKQSQNQTLEDAAGVRADHDFLGPRSSGVGHVRIPTKADEYSAKLSGEEIRESFVSKTRKRAIEADYYKQVRLAQLEAECELKENVKVRAAREARKMRLAEEHQRQQQAMAKMKVALTKTSEVVAKRTMARQQKHVASIPDNPISTTMSSIDPPSEEHVLVSSIVNSQQVLEAVEPVAHTLINEASAIALVHTSVVENPSANEFAAVPVLVTDQQPLDVTEPSTQKHENWSAVGESPSKEECDESTPTPISANEAPSVAESTDNNIDSEINLIHSAQESHDSNEAGLEDDGAEDDHTIEREDIEPQDEFQAEVLASSDSNRASKLQQYEEETFDDGEDDDVDDRGSDATLVNDDTFGTVSKPAHDEQTNEMVINDRTDVLEESTPADHLGEGNVDVPNAAEDALFNPICTNNVIEDNTNDLTHEEGMNADKAIDTEYENLDSHVDSKSDEDLQANGHKPTTEENLDPPHDNRSEATTSANADQPEIETILNSGIPSRELEGAVASDELKHDANSSSVLMPSNSPPTAESNNANLNPSLDDDGDSGQSKMNVNEESARADDTVTDLSTGPVAPATSPTLDAEAPACIASRANDEYESQLDTPVESEPQVSSIEDKSNETEDEPEPSNTDPATAIVIDNPQLDPENVTTQSEIPPTSPIFDHTSNNTETEAELPDTARSTASSDEVYIPELTSPREVEDDD